MPKAKSDKATAPESKGVKTAAPASRNAVVDADTKARKAEREAAEYVAKAAARREEAEKRRKAFERQKQIDVSVQNRHDSTNPTVSVIVQTKRERPVRLRRGVIPSRTMVKVTRRELRRLQGMMNDKRIQLIVGELEKPGDLVNPKTGKPVDSEKG